MIYALGDAVPEIHPDAWVAPGAVIVGKVRLKAGASVWFGSVLRGDNEWIEIGENTNVQENCTLHTDIGFPLTVGDNCTIGHNVLLHGCQIGQGTLIGMKSTIMNGSVIGDSCLVGAASRPRRGHAGRGVAGDVVPGVPGGLVGPPLGRSCRLGGGGRG